METHDKQDLRNISDKGCNTFLSLGVLSILRWLKLNWIEKHHPYKCFYFKIRLKVLLCMIKDNFKKMFFYIFIHFLLPDTGLNIPFSLHRSYKLKHGSLDCIFTLQTIRKNVFRQTPVLWHQPGFKHFLCYKRPFTAFSIKQILFLCKYRTSC